MATTRQEFKDLALELKAEFADFFIAREFIVTGDIHPVTGVETGGKSEVIECFRDVYKTGQIDGQQIQAKDFKLLVIDSDIKTIDMRTDDLKVVVDGVKCEVVNTDIDGATAAWTLQVRG